MSRSPPILACFASWALALSIYLPLSLSLLYFFIRKKNIIKRERQAKVSGTEMRQRQQVLRDMSIAAPDAL
jgi:hypothetical protein